MTELPFHQSARLTREALRNGSAEGLTYKSNYHAPVAWFFWLCGGLLGFHRYYLGQPGVGLLMTFTLGEFGVWWTIDAFLLPGMLRKANGQHYAISNHTQFSPGGVFGGGI